MAKFTIPEDQYEIKPITKKSEGSKAAVKEDIPAVKQESVANTDKVSSLFKDSKKKKDTGCAKTVYLDADVHNFIKTISEENQVSFSLALNLIVKEFMKSN